MERVLMRLMRESQVQSSQRGAAAVAAFSSQQVREYLASSPSDGFSHSVLSEPKSAEARPVFQGWSRGYATSSVQNDDGPQGNVKILEFGTHKTTAAKRFAVGTTAVDVNEVQDPHTEEEIQERAKEVLQQVGEKIDDTVEESQLRQLQEKLVRTEGIGEVVQDLYNNKPELEYQAGDR